MVMSAPGHIVYSSYNTLYGHSLSGGGLVTLKALIISLTVHTHDVICGARSRVWRRFKKQAKAYKEANPQMCVHNRVQENAGDVYLQLKVLSMGRQKQ